MVRFGKSIEGFFELKRYLGFASGIPAVKCRRSVVNRKLVA